MTEFYVLTILKRSFVNFVGLHFKNIGFPFIALEILVE